jgi:hypothetical protein
LVLYDLFVKMSLCLARELRLQACVFVCGELTETAPRREEETHGLDTLGGSTDWFMMGLQSSYSSPEIRKAGRVVNSHVETGYVFRIQSLSLFAVSKQTVATLGQTIFQFTMDPRSEPLRHSSQITIVQWASGQILLTRASSTGSSICKSKADRSTPAPHKTCVAQIFTSNAVQSSAGLNGSKR